MVVFQVTTLGVATQTVDPAQVLREYAASDHAETMGATVVSRRALNEAAEEIERLRAALRENRRGPDVV